VTRCLICGDSDIAAIVKGLLVRTTCAACRAVLVIEFDPPDRPGLRARIERTDDSDG
jgi:hypothetical protein